MKLLLVVLCLSALVFASAEDSAYVKWQQFKYQYDKSYTPAEEKMRFGIFQSNLQRVEKLNAIEPHHPFGVSKFMDLSPEEFKELYLMKNVPKPAPGRVAPLINSTVGIPASFDWRSKGVVSPVKNQGQCGSCWDFSATETIESVCDLAGYGLNLLSEQQILDCDTTADGCDGGWPYWAYEYIISAGGIETESDYPYTAEDGSCAANSADFVACKPYKWEYVTQSQNEQQMQSFMYSNSPLSVCVDASSWQYYTGGVIMGSSCGQQIDHCVQATGWTTVQGTDVWIVRNSWGSSWGLDGYLYVQRNVDACAIAQVVTVPCVHSKSSGSTVC
jgi:C1A family cysteine protease